MGDLKPIGSEKLNGDDKLKRILELTYYNQTNTNKKSNNTELVKESTHGMIYGIVKEKDGYYVKKGLSEQSLDYIGGMFMKNKNKFKSYSEALKRLELLRGQDQLSEAKKYVLKQNKTEQVPQEEPMPMDNQPSAPMGDLPPSSDTSLPPLPSDNEMGDELPPSEPSSETSPQSMESKKSDYMAEIQKYAGKLGQELRDQQQKLESDDIKYVLNMIISAVDLNKLEDEDIEEIGEKFSREDKEQSGEDLTLPEPEPSDENLPEPESLSEPTGEESPKELGEMDDMSDLEEFINNEVDFGTYVHQNDTNEEMDDLEKYSDMREDDEMGVDVNRFQFKDMDDYENEDRPVELDIDEIKGQINKSVDEILAKHFKK